MAKEYALYKGDEFLSVGTIARIARDTGVKSGTISYYKTATYAEKLRNRKNSKSAIVLIQLDEDEDEDE